MEKKLTMTCRRRKMRSKTETRASNLPKNPIQSLQSIQTLLKIVFRNQNQKNPKEMKENNGEFEARSLFKNLNPNEPINWSWSSRPPGQYSQQFDFSNFLRISSFCDPPYLFQMKSLVFFIPNAKGIFIFGRKLTNI